MMPPSPSVSVVVPTRDRGEVLLDCIESVLDQDLPPSAYEVIVVDDGSAIDPTPEIEALAARSTTSPAVRVICQQPGGLNAARNTGVGDARALLIAFLDDDVVVPETWLRELVQGAGRHPEAGCFSGPIQLRLEGPVPRMCGRHPLGETELDLGTEEMEADRAYGANFAIRREAFDTAGPFDSELPIYGEEMEWEQRLKDAGGSIVYLPGYRVWHRRGAAQLRLRSLMKGRFRRGRSSALLGARVGHGVPSRLGGLRRLGRGLKHAAGRRCWGGVLISVYWLGFVLEPERGPRERLNPRVP